MAESLYDLWAKKNPDFETRFEPLLRQYCDYGKGYNELTESKAKILGAGYELYIIAFFIGLYANKTKPLFHALSITLKQTGIKELQKRSISPH